MNEIKLKDVQIVINNILKSNKGKDINIVMQGMLNLIVQMLIHNSASIKEAKINNKAFYEDIDRLIVPMWANKEKLKNVFGKLN